MLTDAEIREGIRQLVAGSLPISSMRGLDNAHFVAGETPIQYSGPTWNNEEVEAAIFAVLRGKWLSSGENVARFERAFSKHVGRKHSVMCNSGSSANLLMMAALKSRHTYGFEGIEVITPVVCFPTTVAPILQCGFVPRFVDIESATLNLDLDQFEKAITSKTKAVIFAHVLGNPPDLDRVQEICRARNVLLLEDNCDALGSTWRGKPVGSFGVMSSHSFYPAHHITTGEGGMVSMDDDNLAKVVRGIAWWGRDCYCIGAANLSLSGTCGRRFDRWLEPGYSGIVDHKYVYQEVGYNLKPLDLQGAIGLVQLGKLEFVKQARKRIYDRYFSVCRNYSGLIRVATPSAQADVSWFGFPITVTTDKFDRAELVNYLEGRRIQTRNYFSGNILYHPPYAHLGNPLDYPHAGEVMRSTFFIGVHPAMTDKMIEYVQDALEAFLKKW
jgi:CDP-6-deoxy-D-xylo-4-hexulose-3-dehydrase